MLTNAAGPRWSATAGKLTPNLSDEDCKALIECGAAEEVGAAKARKAVVQAETAEGDHGDETAAAPVVRRGRRGIQAAE